jgi:hypothetical protein
MTSAGLRRSASADSGVDEELFDVISGFEAPLARKAG